MHDFITPIKPFPFASSGTSVTVGGNIAIYDGAFGCPDPFITLNGKITISMGIATVTGGSWYGDPNGGCDTEYGTWTATRQ
jgi:hypothetical protein